MIGLGTTVVGDAHEHALGQLVARAKIVEGAVALAGYGSTATRTWTPFSDLDLILWIDGEVWANSVHFTFQGVPVDLNLKSLAGWQRGDRGWLPPADLAPIWDPQDIVRSGMDTGSARPVDPDQYRYAHTHRLLKLQQYVGVDDDVADLLAAGATHWIAVSWCHARGLRFPGIDKLVVQWRREDPQMVGWLLGAMTRRDERLEQIRLASERALAPVGGLLRADDIYITPIDTAPLAESDRVRTLVQLEAMIGHGKSSG